MGDASGEDAAPGFLRAPGELARLIAAFDWSSTAIGPIESWPQSLKTIVGFMLRSPVALVLLWKPDGVMIYNDAYAAFAGHRHPQLLGMKVREAWPEVAEFNDNVMSVGLGGGTLAYRDQELALNRAGVLEPAWLDLDYSPVPDESGAPAGVMAVVVETTKRVLAERRAAAEQAQQRRSLQQMPGFVAILTSPGHVFEYVNDAYVALFGRTDLIGRTVREAFPDLEGQGFFELLDQVYRTGEPVILRGQEIRLDGGAAKFLDFIYGAVRDETEQVTGIFVGGYDVTDANRAVAALAESEARYRTLFNSIASGFCIVEMKFDETGKAVDYKIVEGNAAFEEMTGLYGSSGKWVSEIAPGLEQHWFDLYGGVALTGEPVRFENPADVLGRWYDVQALRIGEPGARRVAILFNNITERRQVEEALRENERRLRFLDALSTETAKLTDADSVLETTTRMVAEHLNISNCAYADMDEDQDGFTIRGDWAAVGSPSIVGHYRLADFGKLAVQELGAGRPLIVKDNLKELAPEEAATFQNIGIAATICMPLVKEGRLTALMAIHDKIPHPWSDYELSLIREVTERSWAHVERVGVEAELRASEANFRTLARALPNHVWTSRPDGQLDWFNEQVYAFSGAAPGSLDGAAWTRLVHPNDVGLAEQRWAGSLATGETYEVEFRLRGADGAYRWHIARAIPIKGGGGQVIRWIGTNTDIQDQKEIAEALTDLNMTLEARVVDRTAELIAAQEALRQSQKMEAVGQLTGGLAHDFNNLLAGISGSLELLEKRIAEGRLTGIERYIDLAQASSKRAASLTQRLLAFSRRQTLDPRPTDVRRLIAGMDELIRRTVGPAVHVETIGQDDLWLTQIDPSQLENALLNLAINSRDAMPEGGRLTISAKNVELDESWAREFDLEAGQYLSLCVRDTGAGMTPEVAARAFDPFFTTKPLGQGTGLGLSMIHGFVRQSGGHVGIESVPGRGTSVHLYLPRFDGGFDDGETTERAAQSASGSGETILVIDDEEAIRMLISEVLAEAGYRVLEAGDGPEGLRVLQSDERIDLLITDVGLPGGFNGRQVADAARTSRPDLRVLFITGYAENAAVGAGQLEAGMQVITKPFAMTTLAERVREMVHGETPRGG